jgi:hypothetical protein
MLAIVVSCDIKWREEIWLSQPGKRKRKHCHNVQNLKSWSIITGELLITVILPTEAYLQFTPSTNPNTLKFPTPNFKGQI